MKWFLDQLFTPVGFFLTIVATMAIERALKYLGLEDWVDRSMGHASARWAARSRRRELERGARVELMARDGHYRHSIERREFRNRSRSLTLFILSASLMQIGSAFHSISWIMLSAMVQSLLFLILGYVFMRISDASGHEIDDAELTAADERLRQQESQLATARTELPHEPPGPGPSPVG